MAARTTKARSVITQSLSYSSGGGWEVQFLEVTLHYSAFTYILPSAHGIIKHQNICKTIMVVQKVVRKVIVQTKHTGYFTAFQLLMKKNITLISLSDFQFIIMCKYLIRGSLNLLVIKYFLLALNIDN